MSQQFDDDIINLLNILSFVVGMQNLQENREQSEHNDVQAANDKQAKFLLSEINRRFEEQNKILEKQNEMLSNLLARIEQIYLLEREQNEKHI